MRPAVSVEPGRSSFTEPVAIDISGLPDDSGFGYSIPMPAPLDDEKPCSTTNMDTLFDFDSFPTSSLDDQPDFFALAHFSDSSVSNPYGLSDQLGARAFDLQNDSGAALIASDEHLAATA